MEHRGFVFSALRDDLAHFCVTGRLAGDHRALTKLRHCVTDSLKAMHTLTAKLAAEGKQFSGFAGAYGTLSSALEPKVTSFTVKSVAKFVENWLFGSRGAADGVKAFFFTTALGPFIDVERYR
jgi:hypothetical protein